MVAEADMFLPELVTALASNINVPSSAVSRMYFPSETVTGIPFRVYPISFILSSCVAVTVKYASSPTFTLSEDAVISITGSSA